MHNGRQRHDREKSLITKITFRSINDLPFYFLHKQVDDKEDEHGDNTDVNTYDKIEQLWV